ncbi:MAG: ankyrin repeat domain-containing protein [Puniceicoccales bacterium]|jgi:hypothetical protein|nr:ankyrin repeat domain-containing protein [Puniceicoccales bacterium]
MVKHIRKKLLGCMGCNVLMVTGFMGNVAHGTQGADVEGNQQALIDMAPNIVLAMATQRIPGDPHGDTYYLNAVRTGNEAMVRLFLDNPRIDFNATDNEGNTDLMLAIKGGGQDIFGENYQRIFNLIMRYELRNWNLQNARGQTALFLTGGWGRLECLEALLGRLEVDPNIPNIDNATLLLAALGNNLVPLDVRVAMVWRLINEPRVDVNRRGTGSNKLPLQIVFDVSLVGQFDGRLATNFMNAICRRSLADYDMMVKRIMREVLGNAVSRLPSRNPDGRLTPAQIGAIVNELLEVRDLNNLTNDIDDVLNDHREELDVEQVIGPNIPQALINLVGLSIDPRVNVANPRTCGMNQLIDAVRRKIHFLFNQLGMPIPDPYVLQLQIINYNTQLYNDFLMAQDDMSRINRLGTLNDKLMPIGLR